MDQDTSSHNSTEGGDLRLPAYFPFGLPISGTIWRELDLSANFTAPRRPGLDSVDPIPVRRLVEKLRRAHPEFQARAGALQTAGLICDILRLLIQIHCFEDHPRATDQCLKSLATHLGRNRIDRPIEAFAGLFPAHLVELGRLDWQEFLATKTNGVDHREAATWEMVVLRLATMNPAFRPFTALYDDGELENAAQYSGLVKAIEQYFARQPAVRRLEIPLFEALMAPMIASPGSLEGQLEYILDHWIGLLPEALRKRLLRMRDILREESRQRGIGPNLEVLRFGRGRTLGLGDEYPEPERFTVDADWMANVVLMAKSTHVWLDQLSKRYGRSIARLDQVPDEELDTLARWGITGLWLIGMWERSPASRRIKQIMGNPEALPSAYSLYDYEVAQDLGGAAAYENFRERAWRRGIRLASDMVPNHMGIYSRWVIEHPHWFLQLPEPPYPAYRYTGENLSLEPRVTLQIEDGYWNHSDAAVVFKHTDNHTGETRYIYHGNDGTSTPWNDTAQLNYLMPEVREAVIQTIVHVARQFPIIRFDAAMTLAKRHYQRLWFPKPGDGGAVPSRAEHGMSKAEFDAHMPAEFWREVVDRVQREAPDTLLIAEAFWLMEGYFVRTLGMHRVYNSAFMNMLKMEENSKYRATIRNVLEFSPEVLKRFVNFMSNPDERTAVDQFGRGDKYFGAAVMMVTMPGLPMFGHGQVEGFAEKYGMEYGRAYWDEPVDEQMVRRHEAEIFPLMRRRYLFSGAANFAFYDFVTPQGYVDENVFAYSNRAGDDRALIVYNNAYTNTQGTIHLSTAINRGGAEHPHLERISLAQALGLRADDGIYYAFRDHSTGLEYLRSGRDIAQSGLFVELWAYQYHAFLAFREIVDHDGSWSRVAERLGGRGAPSVEAAYREMFLEPVLIAYRGVFHAERIDDLANALAVGRQLEPALAALDVPLDTLETAIREHIRHETGPGSLRRDVRRDIESLFQAAPNLDVLGVDPFIVEFLYGTSLDTEADARVFWRTPALWALVRNVGLAITGSATLTHHATWLDEYCLTATLETLCAAKPGNDDANGGGAAPVEPALLPLLLRHADGMAAITERQREDSLRFLLDDPNARRYLWVNEYKGVLWLNRERFEDLTRWMCFVSVLQVLSDARLDTDDKIYEIHLRYERAMEMIEAAEEANYQVFRLKELLV